MTNDMPKEVTSQEGFMDANHSRGCTIKRASLSVKRYVYAITWPLACWHCEASGTELDSGCQCERCLGDGRCPRCGKWNITGYPEDVGPVEEIVCNECDWNNMDVTTHMPPFNACVCGIEELIR